MVGQPEGAGATTFPALALRPDCLLYGSDRNLFSQADYSDLPELHAPDVHFVLGSSLLTGSSFERRENHGPQVPGPAIGEIRNCLKMRTLCSQTRATQESSEQADSIRPFRVNFSEAELTDLLRRINATRWPEQETVTDQSQGVQLATLQALARYWGTAYDWRKVEAKLNSLPNFITEIDGLDIHFIHVRSKHEDALPLIVTHGWPGSIIEQLKIVDPLTNPTAHGASA